MKNLGKLKYFLGLEVTRSSKGIAITQRNYTLDVLEYISYLEMKLALSPMEQNLSLSKFERQCISDPSSTGG